ARVHAGQDLLEVLHEHGGQLGQTRVEGRRLLEVAVQELDERGVELGLALEHGREELPALAVRAAGEAPARGRTRRLPEAVEAGRACRGGGEAPGRGRERGRGGESRHTRRGGPARAPPARPA